MPVQRSTTCFTVHEVAMYYLAIGIAAQQPLARANRHGQKSTALLGQQAVRATGHRHRRLDRHLRGLPVHLQQAHEVAARVGATAPAGRQHQDLGCVTSRRLRHSHPWHQRSACSDYTELQEVPLMHEV